MTTQDPEPMEWERLLTLATQYIDWYDALSIAGQQTRISVFENEWRAKLRGLCAALRGELAPEEAQPDEEIPEPEAESRTYLLLWPSPQLPSPFWRCLFMPVIATESKSPILSHSNHRSTATPRLSRRRVSRRRHRRHPLT